MVKDRSVGRLQLKSVKAFWQKQRLLVLCSSFRRVGRGIQPLRGNQALFNKMLSQPLPADLKHLLISPVKARMRDDEVSIYWNNLAVTTALYHFIMLVHSGEEE